jgi:predicted ATPase
VSHFPHPRYGVLDQHAQPSIQIYDRVAFMALFFISGVPGTGKTTLMQELRWRGEEAHDTDDECIMISK